MLPASDVRSVDGEFVVQPSASPMAQWVKNQPAVQETQKTWARSLSWEDSLE